ncbi:cytochrome c biogenesis protein ResB [Bacillus piscicola]|uniref:cytochrome c biogenesis protein ResB n=1 Tax=Bacillus piscicola TaxID=1632684 RepID=UPI001F097166|nr:cytochrome c biogenesis protein ResB [Bacillus piscicola]
MNELKCEQCGHVNPYGTRLCQACGNPLDEKDKEAAVIDMRYEGVARRSQTYNKTFVDKIWNFFSSVKVGISIIVLTLIASALGTIFPQEMYIPKVVTAAQYYQEEYGVLGQIYYMLGFHNLYGSWWYLALVAALTTSIIIASIDRFFPLYKSLKHQRVKKNAAFMKRQRYVGKEEVDNEDAVLEKAKALLLKRRYRVREEEGNLLAEKGRFARWGPYVNHIGLVLFFTGAMLRFFPGMYIDDSVWVREGDTEVIPGTNGEYFIENEKFVMELYDEEDETFGKAIERAGGMVVQNFQTDAVLYKRKDDGTVGTDPELEKVKEDEIRVNHPLRFNNFRLYQSDYKLNELNTMTFSLRSRESGEDIGTMEIDLFDPESEYDLGDGYKVVVNSYFPNFEFNEDNEPSTKSSIPDNPAFIFQMITPEHPDEGEYSFVGIRRNEDVFGTNDYEMKFAGAEMKNVTGLTVRKDLTLPFIILGASIFMIGLIQGSYWSHRRIWLQRINGQVWVAAHTNKHWESLKKDLGVLSAETGLQAHENEALLLNKKGKN